MHTFSMRERGKVGKGRGRLNGKRKGERLWECWKGKGEGEKGSWRYKGKGMGKLKGKGGRGEGKLKT